MRCSCGLSVELQLLLKLVVLLLLKEEGLSLLLTVTWSSKREHASKAVWIGWREELALS